MAIHIGELVSNVTIQKEIPQEANHGPLDLRDPAVVAQLSDRVFRLMRDELALEAERL